MNRRDFLASGVALGAVIGKAGALSGATYSSATALVLTDVTPKTDPAKLFAVVDTMLEAGIWLTCAVQFAGDEDGAYFDTLKQLNARNPALELAVVIEDLSDLSPYFQARRAFDLRGQLAALSGVSADFPVRTILCAARAEPTAPIGIRTSGFRNVLVYPGASGPTRSETWPNGVVRFFGGDWVSPWTANVPTDRAEANRLLYLSAKTFSDLSPEILRKWAGDVSRKLRAGELAGQISIMPVSDIQLRDNYHFTRYVSVQLFGPQQGEVADFADWLERRGIPVQVWPDEDTARSNGYWVGENDTADGAETPVVPVGLACDAEGAPIVEASGLLPPGMGVLPVPSASGQSGLDDCAMLQVPQISLTAPIEAGADIWPRGSSVDFILSIHPGALANRFGIMALQAAILALAADGVTAFVGVEGMANAVLSHTPIDKRYRRTMAAKSSEGPEHSGYSPAELEVFMEDARRAWAYFEKYTHPYTGLIPATVNITHGGDSLLHVTMWDVGSQINGLVAAKSLGLIENDAFDRAIRKILPQIAGRKSDGRLLPQGWIRTDRDRWGTKNFDGCDVGRLLASLDNLRRHSDFEEDLKSLVGSWDLPDVIQDGEIYSVIDGELHTTYKSHCAHYSAIAFERWGLPVASPYRTFEGRAPADGQFALLEEVARIGPLGAEPLLLEAMELGMSRESAYLADLLFYAQEEEYLTSGKLVAVSETPIKQAPWFIYQGLQLGRESREWAIDTVGQDLEHRTKSFVEAQMAVSSKAAFLWAAYHPGAYADALIAHIREKARMDIGFASNVNTATGLPTQNYTDLNTNGIILQAIAHIVASN